MESDQVNLIFIPYQILSIYIFKNTKSDIRNKHMEWRSIRWQKVNIKEANEETEKQLEALNTLPSETRNWDIFVTTKYEIQNIKV